jgi:hypothetical protein
VKEHTLVNRRQLESCFDVDEEEQSQTEQQKAASEGGTRPEAKELAPSQSWIPSKRDSMTPIIVA